jgi:hypothetical protein
MCADELAVDELGHAIVAELTADAGVDHRTASRQVMVCGGSEFATQNGGRRRGRGQQTATVPAAV